MPFELCRVSERVSGRVSECAEEKGGGRRMEGGRWREGGWYEGAGEGGRMGGGRRELAKVGGWYVRAGEGGRMVCGGRMGGGRMGCESWRRWEDGRMGCESWRRCDRKEGGRRVGRSMFRSGMRMRVFVDTVVDEYV